MWTNNRRGLLGAKEGERRSLGHVHVENPWNLGNMVPSLHVGQRIKLVHPAPDSRLSAS